MSMSLLCGLSRTDSTMPCRKWKYSADEALAIVIFLLKADLFGTEAIQDRACGCLALQPEWPCQSNELLGAARYAWLPIAIRPPNLHRVEVILCRAKKVV
jgi:hypothetical protein